MGFLFGGDTGLTQEQIARDRAMANRLLENAGGRVATNGWEGLGQIGQAIIYNILNARAAKGEKANSFAAGNAFERILQGYGSGAPAQMPGAVSRETQGEQAPPPVVNRYGSGPKPYATTANALTGNAGKDTLSGGIMGAGKGQFIPTGNFVARGAGRVNSKLVDILAEASKRSGYKVEAFSGFRPGDIRQHGRGNATDVRLIDPKTGKPLPNYQNAKSFRAYEKFAQEARKVQMEKYPELAGAFRWGGYFGGGKGKYGALDTMHFDIGGGRGLGMAGGSWESGLTPAQRRLFPGIESMGMSSGDVMANAGGMNALQGGAGSDMLGMDPRTSPTFGRVPTPTLDMVQPPLPRPRPEGLVPGAQDAQAGFVPRPRPRPEGLVPGVQEAVQAPVPPPAPMPQEAPVPPVVAPAGQPQAMPMAQPRKPLTEYQKMMLRSMEKQGGSPNPAMLRALGIEPGQMEPAPMPQAMAAPMAAPGVDTSEVVYNPELPDTSMAGKAAAPQTGGTFQGGQFEGQTGGQGGFGPASAIDLYRFIAMPGATPEQKAIATMLLEQKLKSNDPATLLELQKLQLEIDKSRVDLENAKNPKQKFDFVTGKDGSVFRGNEGTGDFTQVYGGKSENFRIMSGPEKQSMGLDPNKAYQIGPDNKVMEVGGGNTIINNDLKAESAFDKTFAEQQAKFLTEVITDSQNAKADLGMIEQLEGMTKDVGGFGTGMKSVAASYGIALDDNASGLQAAQALINKLVPTQRQPGSGSMSDRDVELFKASLPSLWNMPGGNAIILKTMRGLAEYRIAQGNIAVQVANGGMTRQQGITELNALPNPLAEFRKVAKPKGKQDGMPGLGFRFPEADVPVDPMLEGMDQQGLPKAARNPANDIPAPPNIDPDLWNDLKPEEKRDWLLEMGG